LAVDPQGTVCGAVPYTGGDWYGLLACYGDDTETPIDEGARPGDTIEVRAIVDGQAQVIGTGLWTAHGDRQQVPGGKPPPLPTQPSSVYLPLALSGATWGGTPPVPAAMPVDMYLPLVLKGAVSGD
jgi:hypothetical protein